MKKENGQASRPKTSDKLKMGGTVHLTLTPENLRKVAAGEEVCVEIEGMEFNLKIEPGQVDDFIILKPWFNTDEAEIKVNKENIGDGLPNYLSISLLESDKAAVNILFSPLQADKVAKILRSLVVAHDAFEDFVALPVDA